MQLQKSLLLLLTATAATLTHSSPAMLTSDIQAYPGIQFRVQESFLEMIKDEFFYELPYIVNNIIAPLFPKELSLFLGFFQVKNIRVYDFEIDTSRAAFTVDEQKRGIMMNWAKISNWNFHFECLYILFWPIEYSFNVDIVVKDATLDNGLSL